MQSYDKVNATVTDSYVGSGGKGTWVELEYSKDGKEYKSKIYNSYRSLGSSVKLLCNKDNLYDIRYADSFGVLSRILLFAAIPFFVFDIIYFAIIP